MVHLVGFIIRIYHDALSSERQIQHPFFKNSTYRQFSQVLLHVSDFYYWTNLFQLQKYTYRVKWQKRKMIYNADGVRIRKEAAVLIFQNTMLKFA